MQYDKHIFVKGCYANYALSFGYLSDCYRGLTQTWFDRGTEFWLTVSGIVKYNYALRLLNSVWYFSNTYPDE